MKTPPPIQSVRPRISRVWSDTSDIEYSRESFRVAWPIFVMAGLSTLFVTIALVAFGAWNRLTPDSQTSVTVTYTGPMTHKERTVNSAGKPQYILEFTDTKTNETRTASTTGARFETFKVGDVVVQHVDHDEWNGWWVLVHVVAAIVGILGLAVCVVNVDNMVNAMPTFYTKPMDPAIGFGYQRPDRAAFKVAIPFDNGIQYTIQDKFSSDGTTYEGLAGYLSYFAKRGVLSTSLTL